jgi:hypothetical protein
VSSQPVICNAGNCMNGAWGTISSGWTRFTRATVAKLYVCMCPGITPGGLLPNIPYERSPSIRYSHDRFLHVGPSLYPTVTKSHLSPHQIFQFSCSASLFISRCKSWCKKRYGAKNACNMPRRVVGTLELDQTVARPGSHTQLLYYR